MWLGLWNFYKILRCFQCSATFRNHWSRGFFFKTTPEEVHNLLVSFIMTWAAVRIVTWIHSCRVMLFLLHLAARIILNWPSSARDSSHEKSRISLDALLLLLAFEVVSWFCSILHWVHMLFLYHYELMNLNLLDVFWSTAMIQLPHQLLRCTDDCVLEYFDVFWSTATIFLDFSGKKNLKNLDFSRFHDFLDFSDCPIFG